MSEAVEQPPVVEIKMADGIFIKQMYVAKRGTLIPQHSHEYEHVSMIAVGAFRLWRDGELLGDYAAPCGVVIPARSKHLFQALTDGATVYCIHNISRADEVEIAEEHQIKGAA